LTWLLAAALRHLHKRENMPWMSDLVHSTWQAAALGFVIAGIRDIAVLAAYTLVSGLGCFPRAGCARETQKRA
jgi:hypothetical protein